MTRIATLLPSRAGSVLYPFKVLPTKAREIYSVRGQLSIESKCLYADDGGPIVRESVTLVDTIGDRLPKMESLPPPVGPNRPVLPPTPPSIAPGRLAALAQEYLRSHRFKEFEAVASEALVSGAVIRFTLQHHHTVSNVHPVEILSSKERLAFNVIAGGLNSGTDYQIAAGPPSSCDLEKFSTEAQGLISAEIVHNKDGEVFLRLKLRDFRDSTRSNTFNFADEQSAKIARVVRGPLGVQIVKQIVSSPPYAEQALTALKNMLERAKGLAVGPTDH